MVGSIEGDEPVTRVGFVIDDTAQVTVENDPIPDNAPQLAEVLITSAKITFMVPVSNEQWRQEGTPLQLSASAARAVTRLADSLLVAQAAPVAPATAPVAGLVNVENIVQGGEVSESLDVIVDLIAQLEANLAVPSHILIDPMGWAELRKLRVGTEFNSSLLGAGTEDAVSRLLSVPVVVNPQVPPYTGIMLDRTTIASAVGPVRVANSEHFLFDQDAVQLRVTWRVGHAVTRPERLGVFTVAGPGS